ncbi:ParB/RepB/Spo0J family partition protein [Streptomyces sp. UMAF16]|nr:ParB/RepB/Spo0J family partition protein [Streptomyces sp. UMAF16]
MEDIASGVQGLDALFETDSQFSQIPLEWIVVKKQVREQFEDTPDNKLSELAASIKAQGLLQPILLREIEGDSYELVAGERRYRAAQMAGLTKIPAFIRTMTDEQARNAQIAENIHRENLTHLELAKALQDDLNELGSIQAVLEKHHKSESWVSKMLSLLSLPEETKKLITQNISSDLEVIGATKQIEKLDPAAAKKLVEDLAASKGQESARKKVAEVKEKVKPSKKKAADKAAAEAAAKAAIAAAEKTKSGAPGSSPATPDTPGKDQEPGQNPDEQSALPLDEDGEKLMQRIYTDIIDGKIPGKIISSLRQPDRLVADEYLRNFYKLGLRDQDAGRAIIEGFKSGIFEIGTFREMHLVAYTYGLDEAEFILLNVLGSVKP